MSTEYINRVIIFDASQTQ